ncbi:MAG: phosphatidylglycerophosphatase A [Planctomycetota bacterium]
MLRDRLKLAVVTSGFLGLSPVAPGTAGSLGGVLLAWALAGTADYLLWILCCIVLLYAAGRPLGAWAEARARGKDPGFYVLDEVVGYLVTVLWVQGPSLLALALAFFVFRFFDVVKPPPARRLEALGGGDGILLDDVVAGLYGLAVMSACRLFLLTPERWVIQP